MFSNALVQAPPFKVQDSADFVRKQLKDPSLQTHTVIQPVFLNDKIKRELKVREIKPSNIIYKFQCDLCDANYVGYTRRHLLQRVAQHTKESSPIGKHFIYEHCIVPKDLPDNLAFSRSGSA